MENDQENNQGAQEDGNGAEQYNEGDNLQ